MQSKLIYYRGDAGAAAAAAIVFLIQTDRAHPRYLHFKTCNYMHVLNDTSCKLVQVTIQQ